MNKAEVSSEGGRVDLHFEAQVRKSKRSDCLNPGLFWLLAGEWLWGLSWKYKKAEDCAGVKNSVKPLSPLKLIFYRSKSNPESGGEGGEDGSFVSSVGCCVLVEELFFIFFFPHLLFSHFPLNYGLMSEFSLEKRCVSAVNLGYRGDSDFLICHVTSRDHFLNWFLLQFLVLAFLAFLKFFKVVSFYDSINLWCM